MFHETKVLLDRATPLEHAGEWVAAIKLCDQAFRQSLSDRDLDALTESVLRAGLCYRQMGDSDLAVEQLELAYEIASLHDDAGRASRALNGLATLYHVHGQLRQAEDYYRLARSIAASAGDLRTSGNIDQNLGALAVILGQTDTALEHYGRALNSYRKIGNDRGVAAVLNNLGPLYINAMQLEDAERCLNEALSVCKRIGDVLSEGIVHINRAELLLLQGDLDRARIACDEAFEIVSGLGENVTRIDVLTLYGVIYRHTHKPYLAETHLREAIDAASTFRYPLEEAEAQAELGRVLREQGRNREALQALNRAHELFTDLQAKHYRERVGERIDQLEADFLSIVRSWGESIEAKDRYTRGHCHRVAEYACLIAEKAGVHDRDMVWFRMGAFLHDVGKTEVPSEILNKPGKLTEPERVIIESHTTIGDEMLSSIEFPWDVRSMVRSHHERWDGQGYPDGLTGESIPFTARILRIADVFDALTTSRSYRDPLSPDEAFAIMEDDEGSFDPKLFEIFRELLPRVRGMAGGTASIHDKLPDPDFPVIG